MAGAAKFTQSGPGLVTDLPSELPVLVFTRNITNMANNRQPQMQGSILCLDKRTGRVLFEVERQQPMVAAVEVLGSPEDHTIALQMQPDAITLKFTDNPVPPEPPYQDGVFEKPISALERTKAGSILRALGGLMSPSGLNLGKPQDNAGGQRNVPPPAVPQK